MPAAQQSRPVGQPPARVRRPPWWLPSSPARRRRRSPAWSGGAVSRGAACFHGRSQVLWIFRGQRAAHRDRDPLRRLAVARDPHPALAREIFPFIAVVAVQRRAAKIFHSHRRRAVIAKAEQLGRAPRQIDDAIARVWPTIVDADHDGPAIIEIGHPRIDRQRQRGMRRGETVHIVDFAIGRAAPMEHFAVPGCVADAVVVRIFPRRISEVADLIRLADLINAAAFRHGLAERHHALAEPLIVAGAACRKAKAKRSDQEKRRGKAGRDRGTRIET